MTGTASPGNEGTRAKVRDPPNLYYYIGGLSIYRKWTVTGKNIIYTDTTIFINRVIIIFEDYFKFIKEVKIELIRAIPNLFKSVTLF